MASKRRKSVFGPGLMRFMKELSANNSRDWFQANKDRYERDVREPAREFIREMEAPLRKISKHFVADDRKVGGSLMRIHRDVRFSKDKSPYKTNVGIQFRHELARDVHAPGFYLHIDPKEVFLGVGMWHPASEELRAVRAAIAGKGRAWVRARDAGAVGEGWSLEGDSLKRAPKGYDPEHPMIEDLRRKDFIAVKALKKGDVTRPDLVAFVAGEFARTRPFARFLAKALDLAF